MAKSFAYREYDCCPLSLITSYDCRYRVAAMLLPIVLLALLAASSCALPASVNDPLTRPSSFASEHSIPSIHESAVQARRILQISNIGTISTVFPSSDPSSSFHSAGGVSTQEQRPSDVRAAPIGLMEYYALCGPSLTDPTLLGVSIATTMKNAAAGSNATLSLRYHPPANAPPVDDPWTYLPANLPRFALVGNIERLPDEEVKSNSIKECFLKTHPEAHIWAPGNDIHESWWGRLVVKEVYFFGGFGDRARIGGCSVRSPYCACG